MDRFICIFLHHLINIMLQIVVFDNSTMTMVVTESANNEGMHVVAGIIYLMDWTEDMFKMCFYSKFDVSRFDQIGIGGST